ncbi:uncharacterized protein LOC120674620 [Panicum virgatum]|uniref:uncharacterized protein LOC120674620 n=1 Tax=Panicum virgatum TaxID=38727 RepID=UPI0019D59B9E|nr:uncharacterized protein LOC120674620 [Panicum virgatum]
MKPINLLNKLQFHEMNVLDVAKSIGQDEVKTIALKAEPSKTVETSEKPLKQKKKVESSDGDSTDEEIAMMMKNFKKFMKKRNFKKGIKQRKCYKCGEKDHFIVDCPLNDDNENKDKKYKGKSKDKSYDKEKKYKEKSKEYNKKHGKAHVGEEWESIDDSDNEGTTSLALLSTSSTPKLFNNLSDDEDEGPMCLMAKGTKERNLVLEESLAKKKDKVEKLAMDLSLANNSNVRMSKDHALANDSLARLKNAYSELQERQSRLADIYKNLEVNHSTLWESTKSNSKATIDSNASTSKGFSKCHNHDINACVTNLAKLEEAIKAKDAQIYKLNMLVGKGNLKPKNDFESHPAYNMAQRFPSIYDRLGHTRGNNTNCSKIVNGKSIPRWKKGANLDDLMHMAHHGTKMSVDQDKNKVENTTKVNITNKNVSPPISRNYTIDYTVMIQNGKMVVKYIGAHTKRLRNAYSSGGSAWLIDSGCSNHITGEKDLFTSLQTDDIPKETIVFRDNSKG